MPQSIEKAKLLEIYEKMNLTRKFEEKVAELFAMGVMHGTTHLYIGQEGTGVPACCALAKKDYITSTHRGHGHCIGKGIDLDAMMAEMMGKETGCCKGKGGSMHIADFDQGNLGSNGVVAGGIPIAVGAALSIQMQKQDRVVLCFFGDGATNEGGFHESLNLAAIWKLPVIFLCENNGYGLSMSTERSIPIKEISQRALSYGIPGKEMDGNNAIEVYQAVLEAKEYVKENGPIFLVADTYRWEGHSKSDRNVYRTQQEIDSWKKKCPILQMRCTMLEEKIATAQELDQMEQATQVAVDKSAEFAINSPYPSLDSLFTDIYA